MAIVDYYVDDGFSCLSYDRPDLLSKKRFAYTTSSIANTTTPFETMSFSYTNANWKEQLTVFNNKPITYDNIGNPTQYGANTDSDKITFEWEKGRQLKKMVKTGEIVEFKSNENGLRIQKVLNPDTTNEVVTNYTLHGKNIVHMKKGNDELHFFYDASNKLAIVEFNGTKYAYVHNLQGDIVAILNSAGTAVVNYVYDAWGRPINCSGTMANTLGKINPFRYRGYVYDEETGLYYLRSRYYSTVQYRFLNADEVYIWNVFSYVGNNPIYYCDKDGYAMYVAFEESGFGNPMASLSGAASHGGGCSVGWNTYVYAGMMQSVSEDEGRHVVVAKRVNDFYAFLYDTFIGIYSWEDVVFSLITWGAGKWAGRIVDYGLDFAKKFNLDQKMAKCFAELTAGFTVFTMVGSSSLIMDEYIL